MAAPTTMPIAIPSPTLPVNAPITVPTIMPRPTPMPIVFILSFGFSTWALANSVSAPLQKNGANSLDALP